MADDVYHVTFTKNLPDIQERGLNPFAEGVWRKNVVEEARPYQAEPSFFAFSDPEDALRWATKMQFGAGNVPSEEISILRLKGGDYWQEDPALKEDFNIPRSSRQTQRNIGPEDILDISPLPKGAGVNEEFKARFPEGRVDEWLKYYGDQLRGLPQDEPRSTDLTQIFRTGDPRKGEEQSIGQVWNQVDKLTGRFRTSLTPKQYQQLASPADFQPNTFLEESLRNQDAVAPPWLKLHWEPEKSAWKVIGHEGRHRAAAARNVFGDRAIPVDFFLRAKHPNSRSGGEIELDRLSPEMKQALEDRRFISEEGVQVREYPELTEEPRSTDLVEYAPIPEPVKLPSTDLVEQVPGSPRLTGIGQVFRGIGSMIGGPKLRAVRKLITMAQQGYELLPEEQKLLGDVLDMEALTKQIPGTGRGLEYFRQLLGMKPRSPEEAYPDLREKLGLYEDEQGGIADISTGTEVTVDAYKGMPSQVGGPITNWLGEVIGNEPVKFLEEINNPNTPYAGFFSDDPAVASHFAEAITRSHNTVYPVKIDFKNPLVIDAKGKSAAVVQFRQPAWEEGMEEEFAKWQEAFAEGSPYDGVILKNALEPGSDQPTTSYIPKDSSQIRSRFAEFDPAQSESPEISKAAGGFIDKPLYGRA